MRLNHHAPHQHISAQTQALHNLQQRLETQSRQQFAHHQDQLQLLAAQLNAYSPLATLQRGYSLTRDNRKRVISSVKQLRPGQTVVTQLADGEVDCLVERVQTGTLL